MSPRGSRGERKRFAQGSRIPQLLRPAAGTVHRCSGPCCPSAAVPARWRTDNVNVWTASASMHPEQEVRTLPTDQLQAALEAQPAQPLLLHASREEVAQFNDFLVYPQTPSISLLNTELFLKDKFWKYKFLLVKTVHLEIILVWISDIEV